jgi:sterol 3beta-glucosyltransferase
MPASLQPHDYLFAHVAATIHHGGAGTTSAGLRAGNATFICPFFGDQHFWAEMVYRAGAGPRGCPISQLTTEKLTEAFRVLKSEEIKSNVTALSEKMNQENGVKCGIESFYRNLPVEDMLCEVSLFQKKAKLATRYCQSCGLRMCREADDYLHREGGGRSHHRRSEYR